MTAPRLRFSEPNPTPYLVLLCIGWPLLFLSVGGVLFAIFVMSRW
jgi:hypothetical protein